MNFQVYDLLHLQYHLLESDIFFILAAKDVELWPFTLPFTVQQIEPFGEVKKQIILLFCNSSCVMRVLSSSTNSPLQLNSELTIV